MILESSWIVYLSNSWALSFILIATNIMDGGIDIR